MKLISFDLILIHTFALTCILQLLPSCCPAQASARVVYWCILVQFALNNSCACGIQTKKILGFKVRWILIIRNLGENIWCWKLIKFRYRQLIVYWLRWFFDGLGGRSVRFSVASKFSIVYTHFRFDYFHNYFNYFHSIRQLWLVHGSSSQINNYYHGNFLEFLFPRGIPENNKKFEKFNLLYIQLVSCSKLSLVDERSTRIKIFSIFNLLCM